MKNLVILASDQSLSLDGIATGSHDGGGSDPDPGPDTTPLTLTGTSGNDSLAGGAGNDSIFGLAGNDTLRGNDGNDSIDGGAGNDLIDGGNGADTLIGGDGDDLIDGRAGNDSIDGGDGDDSLYGGAGVDTIRGGAGNDSYYVDDINDVVIDVPNTVVASFLVNSVAPAALQGITDTVFAAVSYSLANVAFVENLTLEATGTGTGATGNELDNVLTGNALSNTLSGLEGNDTLIGGAGNDTLNGGGGTDTASFSGNRSAYTIGAGGANVTGPEGSDVLSGIERLQFADKGVAFDLGAGQAAGNTVRIIGAAMDAPAIQQHPDWVAIGLDLFDSGMSLQAVCELVIPLLALSNTDFVTSVYTNVVGAAPSAAERDYFVVWLQGSGGSMTQAQLLEYAANHPLNETNINLVGLQQTGVEFI
ncbi:MAG: hypothetical protein HY527_02435 [Betaproteobacteria bacterium]|nr:hypothetical protein [Betaproteobacteria bacterium]